ncbi:hypothetical protein [Comamonas aquatica]|uniref:hypothetical protein n=1 Tax=Comamonas aquatica TaxID=225991 RepID=UPI001F303FC3|nr:hypothetical protein [Comamonas aquatica]
MFTHLRHVIRLSQPLLLHHCQQALETAGSGWRHRAIQKRSTAKPAQLTHIAQQIRRENHRGAHQMKCLNAGVQCQARPIGHPILQFGQLRGQGIHGRKQRLGIARGGLGALTGPGHGLHQCSRFKLLAQLLVKCFEAIQFFEKAVLCILDAGNPIAQRSTPGQVAPVCRRIHRRKHGHTIADPCPLLRHKLQVVTLAVAVGNQQPNQWQQKCCRNESNLGGKLHPPHQSCSRAPDG